MIKIGLAPGERDYRTALAQSLLQSQGRPSNFGEGLADASSKMLGAYLMKSAQDERRENRQSAIEAMTQGASAQPWVNPDTGEVAPNQNPSGGVDGIVAALMQQGDNPYAAELIPSLLGQKLSRDQSLSDRDEGRTYNEGRDDVKFGQTKELLDIRGEQAAAKAGRVLTPEQEAQQLRLRKAGATEINVGANGIDYGKPGPGLAWSRDPNGKVKLDERGAPIAVPYQGGSVATEQAALQEKAALGAAEKKKQSDIVTEEIDRAMGLIKDAVIPAAGTASQVTSLFSKTNAGKLKPLLETIKANVGFDKLQAMRAASPTGGALGNVSEQENKLLQSVFGSLEQSQDETQLLYNLQRLKDLYTDIIHTGTYAPKGGAGGGDAEDITTPPRATGKRIKFDAQGNRVE